MDDESKLPTNMPVKVEEPDPLEPVDENATQAENDSIARGSYSHHSPADELSKIVDGLQSVDIVRSASADKGLDVTRIVLS